ncbi:MAG: hypothetical protein LBN10_06475 [Propionibacteriaceae bacterium]|nr:hypothetical protein [Propionibacteriaceae bacterium]
MVESYREGARTLVRHHPTAATPAFAVDLGHFRQYSDTAFEVGSELASSRGRYWADFDPRPFVVGGTGRTRSKFTDSDNVSPHPRPASANPHTSSGGRALGVLDLGAAVLRYVGTPRAGRGGVEE